MATILQITGASVGTLNLTLQRGWSPQIAQRRLSVMGGQSPYSNVVETIPISIIADTAAAVYGVLENITVALDEAERWTAGDPSVSTVSIEYAPDGTTLGNNMRARIRGGNLVNRLSLSPRFNEEIKGYIAQVELSIEREGLWETITAEQIGTVTGAAVGTKMTPFADFSEAITIPSRIQLTIQDAEGESGEDCAGLILMANKEDAISIYDDWTGSGSSVADTYAYGGSYRRYQASTGAVTLTKSIASANRPYHRGFITVAMIRNEDAVDWNVQILADYGVSSLDPDTTASSEVKTIEAGSGLQYVVFSPVMSPQNPSRLALKLTPPGS